MKRRVLRVNVARGAHFADITDTEPSEALDRIVGKLRVPAGYARMSARIIDEHETLVVAEAHPVREAA